MLLGAPRASFLRDLCCSFLLVFAFSLLLPSVEAALVDVDIPTASGDPTSLSDSSNRAVQSKQLDSELLTGGYGKTEHSTMTHLAERRCSLKFTPE